mmetsp:Transcript_35378/g.77314  ORF Transcript_35378/g.77314 Transcript_35378/m.77314 type:complete len:210 (-) Transcript_35378:594-1223(-)
MKVFLDCNVIDQGLQGVLHNTFVDFLEIGDVFFDVDHFHSERVGHTLHFSCEHLLDKHEEVVNFPECTLVDSTFVDVDDLVFCDVPEFLEHEFVHFVETCDAHDDIGEWFELVVPADQGDVVLLFERLQLLELVFVQLHVVMQVLHTLLDLIESQHHTWVGRFDHFRVVDVIVHCEPPSQRLSVDFFKRFNGALTLLENVFELSKEKYV